MRYFAAVLILVQPSLALVHMMKDGHTFHAPGIEPQVFCQNYAGLSWVYRAYHSAQFQIAASNPHYAEWIVGPEQKAASCEYNSTRQSSLLSNSELNFSVQVQVGQCLTLCFEFAESYSVTYQLSVLWASIGLIAFGTLVIVFSSKLATTAWIVYGILGTLLGSIAWLCSISIVLSKMPKKLWTPQLALASCLSGSILTYEGFKFISPRCLFFLATIAFLSISSVCASALYIYSPISLRMSQVLKLYLIGFGLLLILLGNGQSPELGVVQAVVAILLCFREKLLDLTARRMYSTISFGYSVFKNRELSVPSSVSSAKSEIPSSQGLFSRQNIAPFKRFPYISTRQFTENDSRSYLISLAKYIASEECDKLKIFSKLKNASQVAQFALDPEIFLGTYDFLADDSSDENSIDFSIEDFEDSENLLP